MCTSTAVVYVETDTLEQAQNLVQDHHGKHFLQIDGTAYPVPIVLEDGATEMRLHELPPYVTEHQVKAALAQFGEVLSVTETVYGEESKVPGVKTGIRLLKIILNSPTLQTGPTIMVGGERTTLTYRGQNAYCRYCLMPEHVGMGCMQSKRSLVCDVPCHHMQV